MIDLEINRFKEIIKYSNDNKERMESKVKDFYACVEMDYDKEFFNLMQIVRPLFQEKGYIIVELPFKDKEIGALSYKGDCLGYIFLNTSLPKVNVNFALCHEIYHVFYQKTEVKQKVELYINEHYYEHEEEFAANLFAGMLLMPEQSYTFMYRRFQREQKENDSNVTILAKLMRYFEVPYMAALIRCYELKLFESGNVLEELIQVNSDIIRSEFAQLWLDESILNATKKDDYPKFEKFVAYWGETYKEQEYLNARMVNRVLQNMRMLYGKIKGE